MRRDSPFLFDYPSTTHPSRSKCRILNACRCGFVCLTLALSVVTEGPAATVETVAGTGAGGFSADGIDATTSQIWQPTGVFVAANGDVYITDQFNDRTARSPGPV